MSSPSILASPEAGEDLYMYLMVSDIVVSMALFKEANRKQKLVFYTSRILTDPETRYNVTRKASSCAGECEEKAKAILRGSYHCGLHRTLVAADLVQAISVWKIDEIGHRTWGL